MTCKEFEAMINDLACDHLMLASKRAQALAHQEACARCTARLRQERLLTAHLRLVAEAEVVQTPAHVKASLMTAFAQQQSVAAVGVATVTPAPDNLPEQTKRNRWSRWAMAAAAAILILLAVISLRLLNAGSPVERPANVPSIAIEEQPQDAAPQKSAPGTKDTSPNHQPSIVAGITTPDGINKNAGTPQSVERVAQNPKPRKVLPASNATRQVAQTEEVTDYIPLTYLSDSTAFDSGLVVRVQVPRSTLISMGLPMNVESSSELVKADVVIGDDGVARAIRLVHALSAKPDGKPAK